MFLEKVLCNNLNFLKSCRIIKKKNTPQILRRVLLYECKYVLIIFRWLIQELQSSNSHSLLSDFSDNPV